MVDLVVVVVGSGKKKSKQKLPHTERSVGGRVRVQAGLQQYLGT